MVLLISPSDIGLRWTRELRELVSLLYLANGNDRRPKSWGMATSGSVSGRVRIRLDVAAPDVVRFSR